jgi:hypothetical protein
VYLVDEHDITGKMNYTPKRNDYTTLRKRYAFHHTVANLTTFNLGEKPDTIELHEQISNPAKNPNFRWEGFMFDIPAGPSSCRVAIVAGADKATDTTLNGQGGTKGETIDRVVGFAGVYPDNNIPLGPIVQVRRDDQYRRLAADLNRVNGAAQVAWHCAYYITKDTPKQPTTPANNSFSTWSLGEGTDGSPDQAAATNQASTTDQTSTADQTSATAQTTGEEPPKTYDQVMDQNLGDDVPTAEGQAPWGGMVFGFTWDATAEDSLPSDILKPYNDSAIKDLQGE